MRVVQRRLNQAEVMVWLTIVGVVLGSVSVVGTDWFTQRSEQAVDAVWPNSARSRMLVDAESMPTAETTDANTADVPPTTDGFQAVVSAPVTSEPVVSEPAATQPATTRPSTTKPSTTPAPTKPAPTLTTAPPTTVAPTTAPPTTVPPTTVPPTTVSPTTAPPETKPPTTAPPETKPPTTPVPTTLPPETQPLPTQPLTTQPPVTKPPEIQPPEASITGFVLINAKSDNDIMSLYDGAVLSLDETGENLSIRANASQEVGSVVWSINGRKHKVENDNPYALAGNRGDNYGSVKFQAGTYTFKAQMFSKRGGRGDAGHSVAMTVTFTESGDDDEDDRDDD